MNAFETSNASGKVDRRADEGIYLGEVRHKKPKEMFKVLGNKIEAIIKPSHKTLLDVGSATGELTYYLRERFPNLEYTGVDVVPSLIDVAREQVPEARFEVESILSPSFFEKNQFDLITCCGVLCIFDDLELPLANMLKALKPGGFLVIVTPSNENPIDMITRYRDVSSNDREYQSGWNVFSRKTFGELFEKIGREQKKDLKYRFDQFRMPFALPKQTDPMRCWTMPTESDPHQLVNGAGQMLYDNIIEVEYKT